MAQIKKTSLMRGLFVDPLGLEPRMTIPKTVVLPITPWVKLFFKPQLSLLMIVLSPDNYRDTSGSKTIAKIGRI